MPQQEPNLRDYWWVIRRRKWLAVLPPLVAAAAAYALAVLQSPPPLYRATAVVKFERSFNVNTLLLRDIVGVSPVGDLDTNAALVKSFPVLARAAKMLSLLPPSVGADDIRASAAYQAVIQTLSTQVEVTRADRTSLIDITTTASEPGAAARIANSVAEAFRDNDIETRTYQIVEARRFIEGQLSEVGRRLRDSEERLRTFQETNKVLLLQDETRAALVRLAEQESEHERIQRDIRATQVQLDLVSRDDGGLPTAVPPGATPDANLSKLQATLSELVLERDTLLLALQPTHPQVRAVDARIDSVRRELAHVVTANRLRLRKALASQLDVLRARSLQVQTVIREVNDRVATLPAVALETARIEREVKVNERIFSLLKERLQEALIKEKEQVAEVTIVRPALESRAAVNEPQAMQRAFVGLALGAVMGLLLAFIAEALDTSIGAIDDLESLLETPILAVIGHIDPQATAAADGQAPPGRGDEEHHERYAVLPTVFAPRSPLAEAVRGLRTNVLFSVLDRDIKTIVVTSTSQGEGKTTIATNLAIALAQLGKKTLLVETDLRNPSIGQIFGIRRDPGVTDVVLGSVGLDDATLNFADLMLGKAGMEHLLDSPGMDNFFVLPSGRRAPNPSELIGSPGFSRLVADARQRYDYVILDSAPIFSVADAAILASAADGIVCVVRVGHVPRAALRRAKGMLSGTKTPLLGVCLNGVKAELSPDFRDFSYYSHDRPSSAHGRRRRARPRWTPPPAPTVVRAALAILALGLGLWGAGHVVARLRPRAATSVDTPAVRRAPAAVRDGRAPVPDTRAADRPAVPVSALTTERPAGPLPIAAYSIQVSIPDTASGQVLLGEFATEAEAIAFGTRLVQSRDISGFSIVRGSGR
ncbi:MAG TPA: polysaccharide biosynthesis tyrosine autokinase [Methylomirabilota bacterium]|nr:polysaccharide biosynthesis tyrosine autokinase [Methylomirabilota bacterium]